MQTNNRKKKYAVELVFNGETKKKRTNDLNEMFEQVKPEMMYTEMFVKVKHGEHVMDRKLTLFEARKLFADEMYREIFINNLALS